MKPAMEFCKARVWGRISFTHCSRKATRDGFCGTHHPDAVAKRKAKSDALYEEQRKNWANTIADGKEKQRRFEAYPRLVQMVNTFMQTTQHGSLYDEAKTLLSELGEL